jgi:hypothetical protein
MYSLEVRRLTFRLLSRSSQVYFAAWPNSEIARPNKIGHDRGLLYIELPHPNEGKYCDHCGVW